MADPVSRWRRTHRPATRPDGLGADTLAERQVPLLRASPGRRRVAGWRCVQRLPARAARHAIGDTDVITQAEWGAFRPAVSPDGRLIVYATRHETQTGLRVRDLQTGADRWLVWPIQRDEQESGASRDVLPGYAFTPDGRELIVAYGGKINAVNVETGDAREIPFEADVKLDIGPDLEFPYRVDQGPVKARLVQTPAFAPDGKRVVFSVLTKLYTMDVPGGTPKRLTSGNDWEFQPTWSPDGQWIAYVTWTTDGGHIWKMRADGRGQPQRLTTAPAFYTDLAFSPDNSKIVGLRGNAFMRNQTFSEFGGLRIPLDVVWIPATGGDVQLIVPARGVGTPHFAGERDRVYVYSRDGLLSMRFDGTDRINHLKVNGRPNPRSQHSAHRERSDDAQRRQVRARGQREPVVRDGGAAGGRGSTSRRSHRWRGAGEEADGYRRGLLRLGRRWQDDLLGDRLDDLPPPVRRDCVARFYGGAARHDGPARQHSGRDTTRERKRRRRRKLKDEEPGVERFDVKPDLPAGQAERHVSCCATQP